MSESSNRVATLFNAAGIVRQLNNELHGGESPWLAHMEEELHELAGLLEKVEPPSAIEQRAEITLDSPGPPEELPLPPEPEAD